MIRYKEILITNAKIILRRKFLWFFGIFAAFLSNSGAFRSLYGDQSEGLLDYWIKLRETGIFSFSVFNQVAALAQADPAGLVIRILILLAVLILGVFILWLAVVSQGAVFYSIAKLNLNKSVNFNEALTAGKDKFWPLFFLKILEKIIILILLILAIAYAAVSLNFLESAIIRPLYYAVLFLVFAASFFLSVIINYSVAYAVIKNLRLIDALTGGFVLLKRNLIVSIESGIVIFIVNFLLSFALMLILAAIAIPFLFIMFLFYKMAFNLGLTIMLVAGSLSLFIIIAVVGGILFGYINAFWATIFMVLNEKRPGSWLGSIFKNKSKSVSKV